MSRPESQLERTAPLTGAAFVVLSIAGGLLAYLGVGFLDTPEEIVAHLEDNSGRVMAGTALGVVAGALLIWFGGSIWKFLRQSEGPGGRVSVIAFGGAIASGTAVIMANGTLTAAALRAEDEGGIGPETATALFDLAGTLWGGPAGVALAVTVAATAVVALRHRAFPVWWGWVSAVLAVALLILPITWLAFIVAHAWVLVLSVWLYMQGSPSRAATSTAG